jgi:hypothetical protein
MIATRHEHKIVFYKAEGVPLLIPKVDVLWGNHSGGAVYDMNCLRSLERWDRGLESH